ncbi:MAG: flippase-like domain-containing protein [Acidobacteria bacterium]|nr:flippase-like domain-containing protein [Acidobacteriota bacterium]
MTNKIKPLLILLIAFGLAYWFVSRLDLHTVGGYLKTARIWPLALGALLIIITLFVRSLRWQAFLAPIAKVGIRNLFGATSIGFGSIFVIGRAGEIVRPAILSLHERIRPSATLATILVERIFDSSAVVLIFAVNLLFFELPSLQQSRNQQMSAIRTVGAMLFAGVIIGIIVLVVLKLKVDLVLPWLEKRTARLPLKLATPVLNFIRHLADGLGVLLNFKALATTVFYTFCVWGLVSGATWLTLYAFGQSVNLSQIVFILGFGLVGSVVPTPGGSAGAFHAAAAKSMEFLGFEPNLAASIAIVYHLIAFGPPFLIGLYFLIKDDISVNQLREMMASESAVQ